MSLFDRATSWVEKCIFSANNCLRYLPISDLTKDLFLQEYDIDPGKLEVMNPGVDVDRYFQANREKSRRVIRRQYAIKDSDFVILFVSMNYEIKGLDNLMQALVEARKKAPSAVFKLLIVGAGNDKKYRQLAQKLNLQDCVIFAGVWDERIEQIYLASDIFSMPSVCDTFGMTVLEAMIASLPVIISSNVGAKSLVQEGVNGFVVKREDSDQFSAKIIALLDPDNRKKMAQQAHNTACNKTWELMTERVMQIYDQVLLEKNSRDQAQHGL